jgi:hypothetical protein
VANCNALRALPRECNQGTLGIVEQHLAKMVGSGCCIPRKQCDYVCHPHTMVGKMSHTILSPLGSDLYRLLKQWISRSYDRTPPVYFSLTSRYHVHRSIDGIILVRCPIRTGDIPWWLLQVRPAA